MIEHEIEIRVRYHETDSMGYLHHANYLPYFEIGRTELFRAQGGNYRAVEESGLFFVVAKLEVRYKKPARYDDVLTLRTSLTRATPARLDHNYKLFRQSELLCECDTVIACVGADGEIQRIPDAILGDMESLGTRPPREKRT